MKLGIMQPYFFPYIGYWQLINAVDEFILLDSVQFIRHGWIERNRILKPQDGWQYISAPLEKHSRETLIKDIRINNGSKWKDKILRQLLHYKKRAPYYLSAIELISEIFNNGTNSISEFNYYALSKVSFYLGIKTKITMIEDLNLNVEKANAPDEWALNICKAYPYVDEYWNPEGGLVFFNKQKYIDNNIKIKFIKANNIEYKQRGESFEPFLSVIDVIMFNSVDDIGKMLLEYEVQ